MVLRRALRTLSLYAADPPLVANGDGLFRMSCSGTTSEYTVVYLTSPATWPSNSHPQIMRLIRSIVAMAAFTAALPLVAQTTTGKAKPKASSTILLSDSVELKSSPELQKSLDELAKAVQALALRIANDPQLRAAAVQVATGFAITAQKVVAENSDVIQEALKTAAERIATAESTRRKPQTAKP